MIKLWERSKIAKIALKRGVQLTTSERMAEEIKVVERRKKNVDLISRFFYLSDLPTQSIYLINVIGVLITCLYALE